VHAFTVLADPARRCILDLIAGQAEAGQPLLTAGEIAATLREEMGLSQPAVSQHLKVLRDTGFAAVIIDGTRRRYAVQEDGFREVVHWLERYRPLWSQRLDALETELRRGRGHTTRSTR